MVQISLIVLSITGIIIINLINREKPLFKLGGTIAIIIGCALGMLYYYNITMFTNTATIIITVVLSVALLLLAYVIMILGLSYRKGKIDVKKKDISKRDTFKKSEKKVKRRNLHSDLSEDFDAQNESPDGTKSKKEKEKAASNTHGEIRTVGEYLNQIEDDKIAEKEAGYLDNAVKTVENATQLQNMNKSYDELNADETENAEEWTPSIISDDEIEAYMKEQYAWMEENRPENELSMSLIFGTDDNAEKIEENKTYHPEILEKTDNIKDIKAKSAGSRGRKLNEQPREIEIELEEVIGMPKEAASGAYESVPEDIAFAQTEIETQIDSKETARQREIKDEAAALKDWVNARSAKAGPQDQTYDMPEIIDGNEFIREEIVFGEDVETDEQFDSQIDKDYQNFDRNDITYSEEIELSSAREFDEVNEPFDFSQTLEEAIKRGEQQPLTAPLIEEEAETDTGDLENIELLEESIENGAQGPVFSDMLSEDEEDVLSIEEAERYAQNLFVNNISVQNETQPVFVDALSDETEFEQSDLTDESQDIETTLEPESEAQPHELTLGEKKDAEFVELIQLVSEKNYEAAMKKVFAILNAGYAMTPDEKQKMRIVMLTLKAKT